MLHLSSTRDGVAHCESYGRDSRDSRERTEMEKEGTLRWKQRERERDGEFSDDYPTPADILHRWPTKTKTTTTTNRESFERVSKGEIIEVVIEESTIFPVKQKTRKKKTLS